jgi:hypothetical protein
MLRIRAIAVRGKWAARWDNLDTIPNQWLLPEWHWCVHFDGSVGSDISKHSPRDVEALPVHLYSSMALLHGALTLQYSNPNASS